MATNKDFVVKNGLEVGGNIAVTGTVDGRDLANDGTKLNTVETNADVTDATNVTAAGALMDSELTSIASIKALNQGVSTGDSPTFAAATISGTLGAVNTTLSGNLSAVNTTLTGYLRGPASFVIDPAVHGNNSGTVVIAGNLQVDGTQTQINSTTLTVDDINLTLASGAANAGAANGAGITIDGASASLTYASSGDKFVFNKNLEVKSDATYVTVDSADHNVALLGPRSGAGDGMDQGYLRLKSAGVNKVALDTAGHTFFNGGNVGIGTSSPSTELQINGSTDPKIRLESLESGSKRLDLWIDGGEAIGYIAADQSASQLAFRTVGTERVRINADGNVGIGTSTILAKLHVAQETVGTGRTDIRISRSVDSSAVNRKFALIMGTNASNLGSTWRMETESSTGHNDNATLNWIHNGGGTDKSPAMSILHGGNVGIGTTNPAQNFVVAEATNQHGIELVPGTLSYIQAYDRATSDYGNLRIDAQKIGFGLDNGAEKVTFLANGNVGIGTTGPLSTLSVADDNSFGGANGQIVFSITPSVSNTESAGMAFGTYNDNDYWKQGIFWKRTGSYGRGELHFANRAAADSTTVSIADSKMMIDDAGNIGIATVAPRATLDIRGGHSSSINEAISFGRTDDNARYNSIYSRNTSLANSYLSFKIHDGSSSVAQTETMVIAPGKVGIGTNSPTATLHTFGTSTANTATLVKRTETAYGWEEEWWFNARVTATGAGTAYITFQFSNAGSTNLHEMHIDYKFGLYREHGSLGSVEGDAVRGSGSYHNVASGGDVARNGEAEIIGVGIVDNVSLETTGTYAFRLGITYEANSAVKNISGRIKLLNNPATGTSPAVTVTV